MAKRTRMTRTLDATLKDGRRDNDEPIYILYDELLRSRDRLAGLPPLTSQEIEHVAQAMHEVIWYFLTPPAAAKTELPLRESMKAELQRWARDRSGDLYVTVIGALALKLQGQPQRKTVASVLDAINDALDSLTFDVRSTKRGTLDRLRRIRSQLDDRIAYVKQTRRKAFQFSCPPELYRNRKNRAETPDRFFRRVYGVEVQRGLMQADLRKADPAFYNVLHVWCSRHAKPMANLVPPSRSRLR